MSSLSSYIRFNSDFRSSVNLYLSLNKTEKVNSFIPTKSSVDILGRYLAAVEENKKQATLLLGPYGKGKTHLLLILLAVLSMERTTENDKVIGRLVDKIKRVDAKVAESIEKVWNAAPFLPVLISGAQDDLGTPFLIGISDALKRVGLESIIPNTYYGHALECIERWKTEYPGTYDKLSNSLQRFKTNTDALVKKLKIYDEEALELFRGLYSEITSGGVFNPLVSEDVLPMYRNIAEQLVENHNYSGIYIIFDEFSKFIEGQDKKAAGNNMKLLQDLCELATDSKAAKVFFTMVAHKGIKEYGNYLSKDIINSFTGIEGRIEEVQFITSTKNNYELIQNAILKDDIVFDDVHVQKVLNPEFISRCFDVPAFKSTFNRTDFESIVLRGCYPLSPVSAYLLLNVSEKVAQNERTLFTFISKEEQGSMAALVKKHKETDKWLVNADEIYDYFRSLFKKSVTNEYIHNEWLNAEYALTQGLTEEEKIIVKTLALIIIVNKPTELAASENHIALASGLMNAESVIHELEEKGIIYKKATDNTFVFKTRATSDARNEITKRKALRSGVINYSSVLGAVEENKYVLPRRHNYKYSMTRFFEVEYMDVEEFISIGDSDVFFDSSKAEDGKVIYLYKTTQMDYRKAVEEAVGRLKCEKLVVVYGDVMCDVTEALKELDAIDDLKKDTRFFAKEDNKILLGELPLIEEEARSVVLAYINETFSDEGTACIFWACNSKVNVYADKKLVDVVDMVVNHVFSKTIVVNNELINKKMISTAPIKKARLNIIDAIMRKRQDMIDAYMQGTSADSTIYRALFVNNNLTESESNEASMLCMINSFIDSCGDERRCIGELIKQLTAAPYGIRLGVIPVYLAYAISQRDEDVILYFSDREIQMDASTVVNMCENAEDFSLYISIENAAKEKYIKDLSDLFGVDTEKSQESRIQVLYAAMQKWFKGLPQITKNIKNQDLYFGNRVLSKAFPAVKGIMQAVDGNPYEALFVGLPKAFGCEKVAETFVLLKELHDKLDGFYEHMQSRIIEVTQKVLSANDATELRHALREWYEKQSSSARNGLFSNAINEFMKLAATDKYMDNALIAERLSKIVIGVYFDSWNDKSLVEYEEKLSDLVQEVEKIDDENNGRSETLIFTTRDGKRIEQKYDLVDEGTGVILKNIISDALEDFSDLPVNDKVAILLEMIERTIR